MTVTAVEVRELVAIDEMAGPMLSTVTATVVEVARLFEVSRATATIDFDPLDVAVVSQVTEYGKEVSSAPTTTPFTLKVTPATPLSSDAVAESVTDDPEIVSPFEGAVSETIGAAVSRVGELLVAVTLPPPKPGV
jgi:hypothetical protein